MEKNKIRVRISGVDYTLVSTEPPEYIHKVAYIVDKKMNEITKANSRLSSSMAAILTAVNLADEQLKSIENTDNLREQVFEYSNVAGEYKTKISELEKKVAESEKTALEYKEKYEILKKELEELGGHKKLFSSKKEYEDDFEEIYEEYEDEEAEE